jgi:hypothetical protein
MINQPISPDSELTAAHLIQSQSLKNTITSQNFKWVAFEIDFFLNLQIY